MPREDRRIFFENDEVYKALYALCFQKQIKQPPPGQISAIRIDEAANSQVIVHISNMHEYANAPATLEYSQDFLAAALMLFCRGAGIPLPKTATKTVMILEGQVVLRVQR